MFGIKPSKFTEFCGWYGMGALILAYALASFGIIKADEIIFQLLNITGTSGLIIITASKNVIQSVILNALLLLIGVAAVIKILIK